MSSNAHQMKKHILPGLLIGAIIAFAPSQTNAQIRNDRGTFNMPGRGDILVETQANLNLTGGPVFSLNDGFLSGLSSGLSMGASAGMGMPMLKVRVFGNNDFVHRMMLNISYGTRKTSVSGIDSSASSFGVALTYGFEKIFRPAERLNTYIGADASIGFGRGQEKLDDSRVWQSAFGLGVRAFTGMDYYVLPKVYLGFELGYGLGFSHYGPMKYEFSGASGDDETTTNGITFAPYVNPSLRLGFVLGAKRKMHGNGQPTYRSQEDAYDSDEE